MDNIENLEEIKIDVNNNAIVRIDNLNVDVEIEYDIMIKEIVKQLICLDKYQKIIMKYKQLELIWVIKI